MTKPAVSENRGDVRRVATPINLASIDLNLLVALHALLEHRNVTHAAGTVGLSQPAMSRALARLRGMFDDDLLVRTSAGYVRTVRGTWLYDQLPAMLNGIRRLVSHRAGEHDEWSTPMRLAMPDHQALLLGGNALGETLGRELAIEPLGSDVFKRLEAGEVEMAIGQISSATSGFFRRRLYVDGYACLVRADHPTLDEPWSLALFRELQHATRTPAHDGEPDHVANALAAVVQRAPRIVSPNMMGAAIAIAESDMVLTVPRRVASRLAGILPLRMVEPPLEIDPYEVLLLWHERCHRNADHEEMRAQIAASASAGLPPVSTRH